MSKFSVYLLAIGNELTSGKISDTNTAYLAAGLRRLGLETSGASLVRDRQDEIVAALQRAAAAANLVITTGGLGPTSDDLTRNAVAAAAGLPLEENSAARAKLEALFAARKRTMNPNNLRQVQFPRGAAVVTNRTGTADAFITPLPRAGAAPVPVISLPGIPRELEIIFTEELGAWLEKNFPAAEHIPVEIVLRCFGCSESHLGRQIEECRLPGTIEVAYQPVFPEILLTFRHTGEESREARTAELAALEPRLVQAVGEPFVIARGKQDAMPDVVGKLLVENRMTLAAAESCSGGMLAEVLVARPGASKYFSSSAVCYSNEAKSVYLGVRPALLKRYGAVSNEIACEMARGAKNRTGADIAVSITGIAGPEGGTADKPAGTFCIGMASADGDQAWQHFFPHERNMFRRYGTYLTLDLVRRKILALPLSWERK